MHPCLQIQEILEYICSLVGNRSSLAKLARVNKVLKEAALDALYAHIQNLADLIRCFPSAGDLWAIESPGPIGAPYEDLYREIVFRRSPTRAEWDSIIAYTSRVTSLTTNCMIYRFIRLPERTLGQICEWDRPEDVSILFPKLRSVKITLRKLYCAKEYLFLTTFLLTPTLRYLTLLNCRVDMLLSFKNGLEVATICPLLETFDVQSKISNLEEIGSRPYEEVAKGVCAMMHLTTLSCGLLDKYMLNHISSLPTLRSLTIPVNQRSELLFDPMSGYFTSLDYLHIVADKFETGFAAIEKLFGGQHEGQKARLRSFKLELKIREWDEEVVIKMSIGSIITALAKHISSDLLKELSLIQRLPNKAMFTHAFEDLLPLTRFQNLTRIDVSCTEHELFTNYDIDEAGIQKLIIHWPHLQHLSCDHFVRNFGLSSLMAVLHFCPHIFSISVPVTFNVSEVGNWLSFPKDMLQSLDQGLVSLPRNTKIHKLSLNVQLPDHSTMDMAVDTSSLLRCVLPNLTASTFPYHREKTAWFWEAVFARLRSMSVEGFSPQLTPSA